MTSTPGWYLYTQTFVSGRSYLELLARPWWQTFMYLLLVSGLIGLGVAWQFQLRTLPYLYENINNSLTQLQGNYPANLSINWSGEKLIITPTDNLQIPYPDYVDLPQTFPNHLALYSVQPDLDSESLLMFTETEMYVSDLKSWDKLPLSQVFGSPFAINAESLPNLVTAAQEHLKLQLIVLQTLVWIFAPMLMMAWQVIQTLVLSLFVYGMLQLHRTHLPWRIAWQLTMLIGVVAATISHLTDWLYPEHELPMYALSFWILFTIISVTQIRRLVRVNHK